MTLAARNNIVAYLARETKMEQHSSLNFYS